MTTNNNKVIMTGLEIKGDWNIRAALTSGGEGGKETNGGCGGAVDAREEGGLVAIVDHRLAVSPSDMFSMDEAT